MTRSLRRPVLDRLDGIARFVENSVLTTLLVTMMVVAVGQIIAREVFNTGVVWVGELLKVLVLWMTMFAAIAACRDDRHIRIDAISHLLPPQAIRVTRVIVDVFAAIVCAIVSWQSYRYLQLEIEFQDTILMDTPAWIVHAVVPFGFAVTAYRFLIGALKKGFGGVVDDSERGVLP